MFKLVNKVSGDKNKSGKGGKKDNVNGDKENFRTSMFIMGFLVVPLVLVIIVAIVVRLKNSGKLRRLKLSPNGAASTIETRWKKGDKVTKNGFTRLNQESDGEEAESLNKPGASNNSDYDSDEDTVPTMSKA